MNSEKGSNSFLLTLFGFERAKNSRYILLIILIHAACWCLLFFLPVLLYPVRINDDRFVKHEMIDKAILVLLFYLNYYLFIPRFFERKKYLSYAALVLLIFVLYFTQRIVIRANYFSRPDRPFQVVQFVDPSNKIADAILFQRRPDQGIGQRQKLIGTDSSGFNPFFRRKFDPSDTTRQLPPFPLPEPTLFGIPKNVWLFSLNNAISSFALLLLMGGFIRLAYSFIRNQNEKKALENANLNAEVNLLKSQINPHFLFNTLNSIYSQAHARSDKTEFSILKLSELLRYMLYDSGEDKVELAKDIQYLTNYIDLQKIRLSSKVTINYEIRGALVGKAIAPLLLITFIENAFKHGISYSQPSIINIVIEVFEETLTLVVSNPVTEKNTFVAGGLGLKNVTRRLDLLYPGRYSLDIQHSDSLHAIHLKIDLKND